MNKAGLKVVIITEGGKDIGHGHLMRCTALCQAFEEKGTKPVLVINGDETVKGILSCGKFEIFNWLTDRSKLSDLVKGGDIIIIDSYLAEYDFYRQISESVNTAVYLDDNKRLDYPTGIVLNGGIGELDYPEKDGITYLLGPGYIPLRHEFWDVPEKRIAENLGSVLVTFGGDDMKNVTPRILRTINDGYPDLMKKVVVGHGFKNVAEIDRVQDKRTEMVFYPDAEVMKELMLSADIAISAGGQTLYELARTGVPTIAVSVADNQMNNIRGWLDAGFIYYAGYCEDAALPDKIIRGFSELHDRGVRVAISGIGRALVDGKGAQRTVGSIIKMHFGNDIILRKADMKDMFAIYELSNDPDVRLSSFNPESINLEDHKQWFANKLKDGRNVFLVAETGNNFIGQVRFDISGEDAIISISISKKFRGFSLGQDILKKAVAHLKLNVPSIKIIKAYIKTDNAMSKRYFEKAGFQSIGNVVIKKQKAVEYRLLY